MNKKLIKIIGFDADDTLWVNELYYREAENYFIDLLHNFENKDVISKKLLEIEKQNVLIYGYGAKSFVLSMIETALKISNHQVETKTIQTIINKVSSIFQLNFDGTLVPTRF